MTKTAKRLKPEFLAMLCRARGIKTEKQQDQEEPSISVVSETPENYTLKLTINEEVYYHFNFFKLQNGEIDDTWERFPNNKVDQATWNIEVKSEALQAMFDLAKNYFQA